MDRRTNVVGEFEDTNEETPVGLVRHELMVGRTNPIIESITKELELDLELGLKNQAEQTMIEAISKDIDELTSSKDYVEVSDDLLKKLFHIGSLRKKCLYSNVTSKVTGFFKAGILPLSLHVIMLAATLPMIQFSMWLWPIAQKTPLLYAICTLNCILWCGMVVLLIAGFWCWAGKDIKYTVMSVDIRSRPLRSVTDRIPYGAKLKVQEASNTKIFTNFVYVTPEFSIKNEERHVSLPNIDPAILGETADRRKYMIVYWDIDKDVARVVKEIEHFKKFKLNKTKTA